MKLKRK